MQASVLTVEGGNDVDPYDPTVALYLGIHCDPRGVGISHERGNPVGKVSSGGVFLMSEVPLQVISRRLEDRRATSKIVAIFLQA